MERALAREVVQMVFTIVYSMLLEMGRKLRCLALLYSAAPVALVESLLKTKHERIIFKTQKYFG